MQYTDSQLSTKLMSDQQYITASEALEANNIQPGSVDISLLGQKLQAHGAVAIGCYQKDAESRPEPLYVAGDEFDRVFNEVVAQPEAEVVESKPESVKKAINNVRKRR